VREKILIQTFGCAHNQADSETMSEFLIKADFDVSFYGGEKKYTDFDLIIFNTCTVKNPTEDKFFSLIQKIEKEKIPFVICGCIPQSLNFELKNKVFETKKENELIRRIQILNKHSLIGLDNLDKISLAVKKSLNGEIVHYLKRKKTERKFLPSCFENKFVAKIPILQGCLGNCTYCKTKFARGNLKSFSIKEIISQIKKANDRGVREIWLVSQDNGCYGLDIGLTLIDLLKEIVKLKLNCKVRIGMLNPNFAYLYRKELAQIITENCFYKFLHIPLQSASDNVLKEMGRKYFFDEFKKAIDVIREKNKNISYVTDIICGFPTEDENDFKKTINCVLKEEFVFVNVSKYYPRSGTIASKMKLLPTDVVKNRSSILMKLIKSQKILDKFVGKVLEVNFIEHNLGYTNNYISVIVDGEEDLSGKVCMIKIIKAERFSLKGKII
jgi:threonylcarbamoyladenosine tRNA methylthiotransferase CDKAL1